MCVFAESCIGMGEGETPHSFRAGCAVVLAMSGLVVSEVGQIMRHVGWILGRQCRVIK